MPEGRRQRPEHSLRGDQEGILGLEWIQGPSIREVLGGGAEGVIADEPLESQDRSGPDDIARQAQSTVANVSDNDLLHLMRLIGAELARIHLAEVVHGDLTTSNMLLRVRPNSLGPLAAPIGSSSLTELSATSSRDWEVVLIDFGLSSVSSLAEDRAVDLYVLERAFSSTHPASEHLYQEILQQYGAELERSGRKEKGTKHSIWKETGRRLDEVRLRGRKRSMIG